MVYRLKNSFTLGEFSLPFQLVPRYGHVTLGVYLSDLAQVLHLVTY